MAAQRTMAEARKLMSSARRCAAEHTVAAMQTEIGEEVVRQREQTPRLDAQRVGLLRPQEDVASAHATRQLELQSQQDR